MRAHTHTNTEGRAWEHVGGGALARLLLHPAHREGLHLRVHVRGSVCVCVCMMCKHGPARTELRVCGCVHAWCARMWECGALLLHPAHCKGLHLQASMAGVVLSCMRTRPVLCTPPALLCNLDNVAVRQAPCSHLPMAFSDMGRTHGMLAAFSPAAHHQ